MNDFRVMTEEECMIIAGGDLEQALGYLGGATAASTASAAVFGTVTGTASLVTTGALVASGVGLAVLGVGLAGAAAYSLFN